MARQSGDDAATVSDGEPREQAMVEWLSSLGLAKATLEAASEDASFRRYLRVTPGDAAWPYPQHGSLIVMDAPPPQEDCRPFLHVAQGFAALGLPVPEVLADDVAQGFLLLSDLGSQALLPQLEAAPELADILYAQAGDWLHQLQSRGADFADTLPPYDEALLRREMALFSDWLCAKHLGLEWDSDDQREWSQLTDRLVANALQQPQTAVHRDYHSRNLMLDADLGLWIIDFQDAVRGAFTYDLVSLLRDCYIEWPIEQVTDWAVRWFDDAPMAATQSQAQNLRWFFLSGVQRQLKAAGIFARLGHRDGKWHFLEDVPRTLGYITQLSGSYPELDWLIELIETRCLPALSK
ncbi:MAG: phosphotransferase [Pseudomonadota bacterium]